MRTHHLLGARGTELLVDLIDLCHGGLPRLQLQEVVYTKLRELLPHEGFVYGTVDSTSGAVLAYTNVSFPPQYFEFARDKHGVLRCPLMRRWLEKRVPVWYEQQESAKPPNTSRRQSEAFHDLLLRRVALHGIQHSPRTAGWYAFSGLEERRSPRGEELLRLVTPHLHAAFACALSPELDPGTASLSPRELAVLQALACGNTNEQIAAQLCLSPLTIKTHVKHIVRKLGAMNRTHAAMMAVKSGLIDLRDIGF